MSGGLVGREPELADLRDRLGQTQSGRGCLILIAGEAGVGKTTLVRHAIDSDHGQRTGQLAVLHGIGVQGGASPFGPIVEVLRAHLRSGDAADLASGPLADHLSLLLPELGRSGPEGDRATVQEAVRQALTAVAGRRPAVIVLDDLQWADDATLEVLPVLARAARELPLLILGVYRSDELARAHPIRRMRGELRQAGLLRQLTLEPLGTGATTELLTQALGPVSPSVSRAVFDRTDGVPFFVQELAAALAGSGRLISGPTGLELADGADVPLPESVREAVLLQAANLTDPARQAVTAAAVAGLAFDPDLVTLVAGLAEWPDELVRLGLVTEVNPGKLAFRHALIREAFYSEIPWTRRVTLHRAVAQHLEQARAAPSLIAEHWLLGRQPDSARAALLLAAQAFCAAHAYRDAARALRRALDLWPEVGDEHGRLDALERLASCCELAGDLGDAITAWREVADGRGAGRFGDPDTSRLGVAHHRLAGALELQGRWAEALSHRDQAAVAFTGAGLLADAAGERMAAASHLRSAGSFRAAIALLQIAKDQATAAGRVDLVARIIGHEGNARARLGEGQPAVEMVRGALALALDHGLTGAAADIYQRLADSLDHAGDVAGAQETYDEAFSFCSANALEPTAQVCLACLTAVLRQSGDWDRAVLLCRQVLAAPASVVPARTVAAGILGSILALRGQTKKARPLLLEAATLSRQLELAAMEMFAAWGLAIADQTDGLPESAATHCWAILHRWERTEDRHYAIPALRWATTLFTEQGNPAGARACAAALAQIASDTDRDEIMSALAHALGETALLDGSPDQAATQFTRAVSLLRGVEAPLERGESQRRPAAALAALGRREEAVEHLVAAHRAARRLEAHPLMERVATELAALGERADRRLGRRAAEAIASGGLTRRETEVVRLVATGRTNREIAAELFLSPRTVESHVSSIVLKLNCRSRADAARRASELGLLAR